MLGIQEWDPRATRALIYGGQELDDYTPQVSELEDDSNWISLTAFRRRFPLPIPPKVTPSQIIQFVRYGPVGLENLHSHFAPALHAHGTSREEFDDMAMAVLDVWEDGLLRLPQDDDDDIWGSCDSSSSPFSGDSSPLYASSIAPTLRASQSTKRPRTPSQPPSAYAHLPGPLHVAVQNDRNAVQGVSELGPPSKSPRHDTDSASYGHPAPIWPRPASDSEGGPINSSDASVSAGQQKYLDRPLPSLPLSERPLPGLPQSSRPLPRIPTREEQDTEFGKLLDMGFPKELVSMAFSHTDGSAEGALDWILENPEILYSSEF